MANEKRLIDANALKANFVVLGEFAKDLWHAGTIRMAIDNAPTVDAVEVVRCKDCKHFDRLFKGEGVVNKIGTCHLRDDEGIETAQSCDDFCSYGERRTDG